MVGSRREPSRGSSTRARLGLPRLAAGTVVVLALALGWLALHSRQPSRGSSPSIERSPGGRPVIFVGLDAADWELLDDYVAGGTMPNLAGLLREGQGGVLVTEQPPLSPILWTTMMTGVGPLEHGILDFTRFDPDTGRKEPITTEERRAPAVWNVAGDAGLRVGVLGLWATHPAEPVHGLLVSERLFSFQYRDEAPPRGAVYPASREAWARSVRARAEEEVGLAELRRYLPWLDDAGYREAVLRQDPYGHPVSALRRILSETRVYHGLASSFIAAEKPDLAIVYFQGTDSIGHLFAPYAPPRQKGILEDDFNRYAQVPELYFAEVDRILGDYRDLARKTGAVLFVASDHGFAWKGDRPSRISSLAQATAGKWHRDEGMYLLWGPGIEPDPGHSRRGGIARVCSTILAILGLPPGKGMAGPPLPGAPASQRDERDYRAGYVPFHAPHATSGPEDREDLDKLRALGYVGAGESAAAPPAAWKAGSTRTAGSYNNEGLILRGKGRADEAEKAFERAMSVDPGLASAPWNLSELLLVERRDPDRSDELLVRAVELGLPEGVQAVAGRAIVHRRSGDIARSVALLDRAVAVRPAEPELRMFRGRYRLEREECAKALEDFREAARLDTTSPLPFTSQGLALLCLGDRAGARSAFARSLALDPGQPEVRRFLDEIR